MSSDEIHQNVTKFFDLKKQGGAVSVLSVFVGTIYLLLKLPTEQLLLLRSYWYIITIPSALVLISWMFSAYIAEIRNRTSVEEKTQASIAKLTENINALSSILVQNFDKLIDYRNEDRLFYVDRISTVEDHLKKMYVAMEKRGGYKPGPDTEKFITQQ